jgi:L-asparaginase
MRTSVPAALRSPARGRASTLAVSVLALMLGAAPISFARPPLPHVRVLATGGTIAGAQSDPNQAGYKAGSFSVEDLIKAVPQMKELAELSGEQVANIGSQTMNDAVWLKLAKRTNEVLRDPKVSGVVVTHGTDTMEETGYFLSLVTKSDKPVVFVGSMRPATAISADGPANLYNAVALAANPEARGRGVLVVLNDEVHFGREAEKMNCTQLDTFHSPNRGRAGIVNTGKAKLWSHLDTRFGPKSEFSVEGLSELPRVEIVYSYANAKRDVVDYWVAQGVKGIVLAGVGDGNATDDLMAGLTDAAKKGVAVVRASRTGSGLVARNMEVNDDQLGFVASEGLNPAKARVLLMLGLTKTKDPKELQRYFVQY